MLTYEDAADSEEARQRTERAAVEPSLVERLEAIWATRARLGPAGWQVPTGLTAEQVIRACAAAGLQILIDGDSDHPTEPGDRAVRVAADIAAWITDGTQPPRVGLPSGVPDTASVAQTCCAFCGATTHTSQGFGCPEGLSQT